MTVSSAICPFCGPTRARVRWTFSNLLRAAANACLVPFWPHFNFAAGALLAGFTVCWGLPLRRTCLKCGSPFRGKPLWADVDHCPRCDHDLGHCTSDSCPDCHWSFSPLFRAAARQRAHRQAREGT